MSIPMQRPACNSESRKRLAEAATEHGTTPRAARDTDAAALVALYDERIAMTKAFAADPWPNGDMVREILDKGDELDTACEDFRRRYYPRAHRIVVGLRTVMATSATGSSVTTVYCPDATATPAEPTYGMCTACGAVEVALVKPSGTRDLSAIGEHAAYPTGYGCEGCA